MDSDQTFTDTLRRRPRVSYNLVTLKIAHNRFRKRIFSDCKLSFYILCHVEPLRNQRTIGPENAHLKHDLGAFSHNEMTLTLNTHTPLLASYIFV